MHGLPQDIELRFFVGSALEQLCFSEHQVILKFDRRIVVSVESEFRLAFENVDIRFSNPLVAAAAFVQFLPRRIESVSHRTDGTLTLIFEGAYLFEVFDTSAVYESYQVHHGEKLTVV